MQWRRYEAGAGRAGRAGRAARGTRGGVGDEAQARGEHAGRVGLVDVHTHLLWGLDDGPGSLEESVELAVREHAHGVVLAVATPHVSDPGRAGLRQTILERTQALGEALVSFGCSLAVRPGAELRVGPELLGAVKSGQIITMGDTPLVLLETGLVSIPLCCDEVLFELALSGFRPVLAHPERNVAIQRNPALALSMAGRGAVLQVDAGSLLGAYGPLAERTAIGLLKSGAPATLGSDAHGGEEQAGWLERAFAVAVHLVGAERATRVVTGRELGLEVGPGLGPGLGLGLGLDS